jgi:hypothetical protein
MKEKNYLHTTLPVGRNTSGEKAIAFTHLQKRNSQALKNAETCLHL